MTQPNQTAMFRCDRQAVTLTVGGCARMWQSAREKRPAPWEGRHNCVGCPLGATHAGDTQEVAAKARASEALRRICPRCTRPAARLINGRWCISCYNRVREVARGKNAKGNLPVIVMSRLHNVALTVARPWPSNHPPETESFTSVTSRTEAMILAAKREAGPVFFGRPTLHHASHAA